MSVERPLLHARLGWCSAYKQTVQAYGTHVHGKNCFPAPYGSASADPEPAVAGISMIIHCDAAKSSGLAAHVPSFQPLAAAGNTLIAFCACHTSFLICVRVALSIKMFEARAHLFLCTRDSLPQCL